MSNTSLPITSGWLALEKTLGVDSDTTAVRAARLAYYLGWANCATQALQTLQGGGDRAELLALFTSLSEDLRRLVKQ